MVSEKYRVRGGVMGVVMGGVMGGPVAISLLSQPQTS